MTANIAATRVAVLGTVDYNTPLGRTIEFPRYLAVHIPALGETRTYDLDSVTDEQLWNMLEHGASQKLGDAAAGKEGAEAEAAVTKREKTLWADGRVSVDPVTSEMHAIACLLLKSGGAKAKELPTLKQFPTWLEKQTEDDVAKIRQAAEARVALKKAENEKIAALGVKIAK